MMFTVKNVQIGNDDLNKTEPLKKTRSVQLKKQSTELSKPDEPGKLKKKEGKRPATISGQPVRRKLKRGDVIGGDAIRDVHVSGTIDEVG